MSLQRRDFLRGAAAAVGTSALVTSPVHGKPVAATLDGRLELGAEPEEVIVTFRDKESVSAMEWFDFPDGYYEFETLPMAYTVATSDQIERLAQMQSVRKVTPNYELEFHNDDAGEETGARDVEDLGYDGRNAHVAVIDSGLSEVHPDHGPNVVDHYQRVNPLDEGVVWAPADGGDTDDNGHGTHVAGSVAGDGSAVAEYRGMAPRADLTMYATGVTILVLDSLGAYDHLLTRKLAGRTDIRIVNNSYGPASGYRDAWDPDAPTNVATFRAFQAGILSVWSAGNCGPDGSSVTCQDGVGKSTLNPGSQAPWCLSVAATDDDRNVTAFSSRGRPDGEYDLANKDREAAFENYREYRRSLRPPEEGDETERVTGVEFSFQGVGVLGANVGAGGRSGSFTVGPDPDVDLETVDGYFTSITLSWSPSTGGGVPEPSEYELRLVDPDGETVATAGSTFVDRARGRAQVTLESWVPLPDGEATYTVEVFTTRSAGSYQVDGDVFAVDAVEGFPDPERPYGLYRPSIGAPGNDIWSTATPYSQLGAGSTGDGQPYYAQLSGTSMSSPVVAGIAALLNDAVFREYREYPEVIDVIDVLESTAELDDGGTNQNVVNIGEGFVDAEAALEELLARYGEDAEEEDGEETPGNRPEDPGRPDDSGRPDDPGNDVPRDPRVVTGDD